ncbi:MAG: hypothetical protein IKP00_17940 [Victivallales bacterium]|nr:hypothetical protein [Victivallales bacterium]
MSKRIVCSLSFTKDEWNRIQAINQNGMIEVIASISQNITQWNALEKVEIQIVKDENNPSQYAKMNFIQDI